MKADDVATETFKAALRGYAENEVDEFLNRLADTLRKWESGGKGDLTPIDVQQQKFKVALRGYSVDEVDQFLDEAVTTLRGYKQHTLATATPPEQRAGDQKPVQESRPFRLPTGADGDVSEFRKPPPETVAERPPLAPPEAASLTAARLLITRPDTHGGRTLMVMFDDRPLGKLRPGGTAEFDIPTGLHWVTVKTRRHESNTMIIDPQAGDQIRLECHPAGGDLTDNVGRSVEGILLERVDS